MILIPTNTVDENDPRRYSERARCRFNAGMQYARNLRLDLGRANVLVVCFGGWSLYEGLPLVLHHVHAAIQEGIVQPVELDLITGHGNNTMTDLVPTLEWTHENWPRMDEAITATSAGHAERLAVEANLHSWFPTVLHLESNEPRGSENEDANWSDRAREIPAHQFRHGVRAGDVARNAGNDSFRQAELLRSWAEANPTGYQNYLKAVWETTHQLLRANTVVRIDAPTGWQLQLNCRNAR